MSIESAIKYEGYLNCRIVMLHGCERRSPAEFPADLDYSSMAGLSREMVEKLRRDPTGIDRAGKPHSWCYSGICFDSSCSTWKCCDFADHPESVV